MDLNPTGSFHSCGARRLDTAVSRLSTAALPFVRCFVHRTRSQRHPSLAPRFKPYKWLK